jgi:hypothetical protein
VKIYLIRRIRTRRGPKKAAVAVAHSLFVRCFMLAKTGQVYRELGSTYFDERRKQPLPSGCWADSSNSAMRFP